MKINAPLQRAISAAATHASQSLEPFKVMNDLSDPAKALEKILDTPNALLSKSQASALPLEPSRDTPTNPAQIKEGANNNIIVPYSSQVPIQGSLASKSSQARSIQPIENTPDEDFDDDDGEDDEEESEDDEDEWY